MSPAARIAFALILLSFIFLTIAFLAGCRTRFSAPLPDMPTQITK